MEELPLSRLVDQGIRHVTSASLKGRPEQATKVLLGFSSLVRVMVITRIRRRHWGYAFLVLLLAGAAVSETFLFVAQEQETAHGVALLVLVCITMFLLGLAGSGWWRYFKASVFLRKNDW